MAVMGAVRLHLSGGELGDVAADGQCEGAQRPADGLGDLAGEGEHRVGGPSVRCPVCHSPYSTVSASRANIRVLISWTPKPLTATQSRASRGRCAGTKNSAIPPTTVNSPQYW